MSPPPGFRLFGSEFPGLPVRRGLNYFGGHRDTWATERSQSIIRIGSGALSRVEDQVIIPDQSIFSQTGDVSTPRKDQCCDLKLLEISRGTHLKFTRLKEDCIATQNVTLDKSFPCQKVSESLSHLDSEKQSFILPAVWGISISATPQRSFILPAAVWYICEAGKDIFVKDFRCCKDCDEDPPHLDLRCNEYKCKSKSNSEILICTHLLIDIWLAAAHISKTCCPFLMNMTQYSSLLATYIFTPYPHIIDWTLLLTFSMLLLIFPRHVVHSSIT